MEGVFFQKRIVFLLFQTIGRPRALFVPARHVARGRFTQSFRFGAFQGDNFLWHIPAILSPEPEPVALPPRSQAPLLRLNRKVTSRIAGHGKLYFVSPAGTDIPP
jgi:hypothetical protein